VKKLYILRHAKSSWSEDVEDFERGLKKRGYEDIISIAKKFKSKQIAIDAIFSSNAKRAKITAEIFAAFIGFGYENIKFSDNLYFASSDYLINFIKNCSDKIDNLVIVGHNPELTELINILSDFNSDNLPTSAICEIKFNIDSWKSLQKGKKGLYLTPKLIG